MPQIIIDNLASKTIESEDKSETLLQILLLHTDWMHACGGKGNCTTCKVIVHEGMEHLGERSPAELKFLKLNKLRANERLSCQVRVLGDITVSVADEYKLPHLNYTD